MADITNVGSATVSSAGNATKSITLSVPSGVANGDELLAALAIQNTTPSMTAPGGWTLVTSVSNATPNGQLRVYRRVAASEPASYTWTTDANGRLQGVMRAYRNTDTSVAPFGSGQSNASSATLTAPSQTTTQARSMLVFCGAGFSTDALTCSAYSSPLAEVVDQNLQFGQVQSFAEGLQVAVGASGTKTCTLSSGEANLGALVVLTPPVSATDAWKHAAARFRLRTTAWSHRAARFRLLVNATQDAGARFRLTTPQFRDVTARFSLLGSTVRDVAARFRVEALGYSDRAVRLRLQGRTYADVAARFKLLGGQTTRDVAVRLRLAGQSTSDRALRLRLRATAYSNRAVRFVVRVAGFKDRGARFILNRIVHLNSGVNTPFGGSSSTVQISTNFTPPQTGSTLLAHVFLYGTPSLTPANGWTQAVAATTSDALQKVAVFYRRSGPSDSALSTETVATLSGACFWLSAYDEYRALGALLTSTANASDGATKTSSATSPPAGRFALGIASACTFGGGPTAWSNQALSGASPIAVRTDTASVDPLNPTHSIDLDIFDGFVRDTAGSYTATVDDSSMALGAVTLVFFETNHEWSRDVGTRFSITPPVFRNVAARFRVVRGNFSHRALRFVLRATAYRDQTVRFLLVRGNVKDASARLRLRAEAWADGSARFTLGITTWSHVATRFILKTAAWSDRSVRLVLRATSWRDTAARFAVGPPNWAHVAVRFRLLASAWRDRTVRFRLAAAVWSDRTLRFRLRLQAYRDATVRFVLATPNWANAALRFVLRAFARRDVAARFRVEVSAVSVSHGAGSGAQIQTGDQRNDTTPTVETAGQSGSVTVQTGS